MRNAAARCAMLPHEAQCCSRKNRVVARRATLLNKEQQRGLKSNSTTTLCIAKTATAQCTMQPQCSDATRNAVAHYGLRKNDGQHRTAMATSTSTKCQGRGRHQATAAPSPQTKKNFIKPGYFLYFQLLLVFPFPESLRLFRVDYATMHHGG